MTDYTNAETLVLHGGQYRSDSNTNAVAVPIYQTTSYQFKNTEHAANLFALKELGNIYTRIMNPTNAVLEERVASIEGGAAALALSSGSSATALAIQNLCSAGDNIVSSPHLYGGTWNLFVNTFKQFGIEVRFADPEKPETFGELVDENTRAFFGETIPNPKLKVFPIEEVANIGKELGIPLIIDNTVSPLTCRPIDHGASIVINSLTKYIGGHGNSIGGIIIDSGNFDWTANPKRQPLFNQPDESYHGAVWGQLVPDALGAPIAFTVRARVVLLRDLGSAISPMNSFNIIQGLETLPLRYKAHQENAEKLANYLLSHKAVQQVIYPSLFEGKDKETADKYLKTGYGPIVGMVLRGGADAGKEFINNLKMVYHVANIGDTRTLAIHPSSTTHSQLSLQDQFKAGVTPGYIRLAVGIEHIDDIVADIDQALQIADKK
ncbi:MAG: O-acetylhomoserine aminocarboxypropyltransferase/cysteine synthase family protein [Paracoccaceae bacterium]